MRKAEETVNGEVDGKDEEVTTEKSGSGTERGKEGKEKQVADM
jgi:hypothetical protein